MRIAVEVWLIPLARVAAPTAAELGVLTAAERRRHASYLIAEPARIFATCRIALRKLLGARLQCEPSQAPIEIGARGKPWLRGEPPVFFNVSHCETLGAIALCSAAPVGIDVERLEGVPLGLGFAASACSPTELACLPSVPAEADATLLRVWTRKEAVLKSSGAGLARRLTEIDLGNPAAKRGNFRSADGHRVNWCDLSGLSAEVGAVAVCSQDASSIEILIQEDIA